MNGVDALQPSGGCEEPAIALWFYAAFFQIGRGELPVLLRPLEPLAETLLLLLVRHVEEELSNQGSVPGEMALEVANIPVSLLPAHRNGSRFA
jgi:hypothetical protein